MPAAPLPISPAGGRTPRPTRRRLRGQAGQAHAEFALVIPLLLFLFMGIYQFGAAFRDYIALTDAVRVGARQAAVSRSIDPEANRIPLVISKVRTAAVNLDQNNLAVTVEPWDPVNNRAGWVASGDVTVRATYPFKINIFGIVLFNAQLNSRTVERVE